MIVGGTEGADTIAFQPIGSNVLVLRNGVPFGPYAVSGKLVAYGQAGGDVIIASASLDLPVEFHGGPGNDRLVGARGDDWLLGEEGADFLTSFGGADIVDGGDGDDVAFGGDQDDLLRGGPGNDLLFGEGDGDILLGDLDDDRLRGGSGRDLLIGGLGRDWAAGELEDDILIGGTTAYDDFEAALRAILREWSSSSAFADRIEHLKSGGGLSDGFAFSVEFMDDDFARDTLLTSLGSHWLFQGENDWLADSRQGDRIESIAGDSSTEKSLDDDLDVQQEPSVAVNPLDPLHVAVAYMDYSLVDTGYAGVRVANSYDGGESWTLSEVPTPSEFAQGAAAPSALFDDQGNLFVSYMAVNYLGPKSRLTYPDFGAETTNGYQSNNGIFVVRSDDGGASWGMPVAVASHLYDGVNLVPFDAAPVMAADLFELLPDGSANPQYENLYVSWTRKYQPGGYPGASDSTGGSEIMIAVSRDGGSTWELQTEQRNGVQRSVITVDLIDPFDAFNEPGFGFADRQQIAVGAEGEVYVAHYGGANFAVTVSMDGAASFQSSDFQTGDQIVFGTEFATQVSFGGLPNSQFRTYAQRTLATDPSRPGRLYAVEPILVRDAAGELTDPADIFFGRSDDFGRTWETRQKVGEFPAGFDQLDSDTKTPLNDDNQAEAATGDPADVTSSQAFTRVAVDEQGNIAVIWYDARRDPQDVELELWGAVSNDGGATFSRNFRISSEPFDANEGVFENALGNDEYYFGDHLGLSARNGVAYVAWTDARNNNQDVYFSSFSLIDPPDVGNDRFEPNETPAVATALGEIVEAAYPRLVAEQADQDWFSFRAAATGAVTIQALFDDPPAATPATFQLELWDAAGSQRLTSGENLVAADGSVVGKTLDYPSTTGEDLLIRVVSSEPEATPYSLSLVSLTRELSQRVYAEETAGILGGDRLLYAVSAGANGEIVITAAIDANAAEQITLQVLDGESLEVLAVGQPRPNDPEVLETTLPVTDGKRLIVELVAQGSVEGQVALELINYDALNTDEARLFFPLPGGPSQAEVADINADGIDDVLVTSALTDVVSVLLGQGNGSIQAPRQYSLGAFTRVESDVTINFPTFGRDVTTGDFDGDTRLDVVATNYTSSDVSVLLGNGDGTLQSQRRFEAGPAPFDLDVGDVNLDGVLDIVTIETAFKAEITVATLLGNGGGTFKDEVVSLVPASGNNGTLRLADFNEDGLLDVAVSGDVTQPIISILLGNGDGSFFHFDDIPAARLAVGLDVGDINRDGHQDIISLSGSGSFSLDGYYLLGRGDGAFDEAELAFSGENATGAQIIDFGSPLPNSSDDWTA